jgi:hypothetical protein
MKVEAVCSMLDHMPAPTGASEPSVDEVLARRAELRRTLIDAPLTPATAVQVLVEAADRVVEYVGTFPSVLIRALSAVDQLGSDPEPVRRCVRGLLALWLDGESPRSGCLGARTEHASCRVTWPAISQP